MNLTPEQVKQFQAWADGKGYDTAYTYDTERSRWVFLNPMTADLWTAWSAALSTQPQQAGWKMVPVEPNLAMLQAGRDLDLEAPGNGWLTNLPHYELRDIWQTMLNAAPLPHPPVHEGGGNAHQA